MIYRISAHDGETSEFLHVIGPNGIAFNADDSYLYITTENPAIFCEGPWVPGGLMGVSIGADGNPDELETLVPGFTVAGDGLALDSEGNLYLIFSGLLGQGLDGLLTSGIYVYTPDRRFNEFLTVRIPGDIFTNIAFGKDPFDPDSLYAYGFTGSLYRINIGIPGRQLPWEGK